MTTQQVRNANLTATRSATTEFLIARRMQRLICEIADKHNIDLRGEVGEERAFLRLEQPGMMPLVIERIGPHQISVAELYGKPREGIADPQVIFFTGTKNGKWVPLCIGEAGLGFRHCARLSQDETRIVSGDAVAQAELAGFCEGWAKCLAAQRWLEEGVDAEYFMREDEEILVSDFPSAHQ